MSSSADVFHAVALDDPATDKARADDVHEEEEQRMDDEMFGRFKFSSLLLGLLVGFFIQFSTLGANFLVITIWGEDVITKSKRDIVVFSLLWSFFTSAMAIVILGFLRNLVSISYHAVAQQAEHVLEELVLHMECRFVVGALVGVCLAWTMTDVMLGMQAQIVYSLVTLVVALFWCRVMMHCFTSQAAAVIVNVEDDKKQPLLVV